MHIHNAADAIALLHLLKGGVDGGEGFTVGNEFVDHEVAIHVVVDQAGKLGAALDASESATLPLATSNELEC